MIETVKKLLWKHLPLELVFKILYEYKTIENPIAILVKNEWKTTILESCKMCEGVVSCMYKKNNRFFYNVYDCDFNIIYIEISETPLIWEWELMKWKELNHNLYRINLV